VNSFYGGTVVSDIHRLSHITLICKDIGKTSRFLKKIFGAVEFYTTKKTIYSLSKEKFFKIGNLWMVTMEGEAVAKTYNHIAFQADATKFVRIRRMLKELGLKVLKGRKRKGAEGDSIYFYDYDNHLFELHSGNLNKRLAYYKSCDN